MDLALDLAANIANAALKKARKPTKSSIIICTL